MLETALVLPILLTLLLGAIQLGLWAHGQLVVQTACEEGARAASAEGGTVGAGVQRAHELLVAGLGSTGAAVVVQGSADSTGVTVSARGSLPTIIPWIDGNRLPLQGQASMRREQFRAGTSSP